MSSQIDNDINTITQILVKDEYNLNNADTGSDYSMASIKKTFHTKVKDLLMNYKNDNNPEPIITYMNNLYNKTKIDDSYTAYYAKYDFNELMKFETIRSIYTPPEQQGGKKKKSYDKCTLTELKEKAAKRKISVKGLNKSEIIAKLRK